MDLDTELANLAGTFALADSISELPTELVATLLTALVNERNDLENCEINNDHYQRVCVLLEAIAIAEGL